MVTLERIVESIKLQLKPHLNDDVILLDEWLIEMINQSRSALIRKVYLSGESLTPFYQEMLCTSSIVTQFGGINIPSTLSYQKITLPSGLQILGASGRKNIQYLGALDYSLTDIQYVELEEFIAYAYHRFGNALPCFTNLTDTIVVRNANSINQWRLRCIIMHPQLAPNYDYRETIYPIDGANQRQLELITFQHIAPKLGLPVDIMNNGQDETKNAPVARQQQQQQEQEEE